ncbi:protein of unknown function DUF955 [Magnetococcus marinus MC-1]|uniref:IrrE N-terminal-like domain-containing protein n=2 Tax=Magnetococcus TaxID=162171 RepID=A0LCT5_MAGMM|nr:protein of unknown function DUF955 [Magnetococcus marinus MC-1]
MVQPAQISKQKIEELAEQFAQVVGYQPGGDLREIIENKLGGELKYADASEWFNTEDGSIKVRARKDFTITLANFTGPLRNRFTIAHELGHYVIHSRMGEVPIEAPRKGRSVAERQADAFAAAFLMPKEQFLTFFDSMGENPDLELIAGHFRVSKSAANYRAQEFGHTID